jgi:hypothetical protein
MSQKIIRVITTASDGSQKTKEFENFEGLQAIHEAIGIDDCSTDLDLRGMPIFRGLIGPMPDGKDAVRYESPDVFEALTKEWTAMKPKRRKRRSAKEMAEAKALEAAQIAAGNGPKPKKKKPPRPRFPFGLVHTPSTADAPVSN